MAGRDAPPTKATLMNRFGANAHWYGPLGGRGYLGHALVGAVMIGFIRNALNLLNVNLYFQLIAIGVIIVLAVESDVPRNHLEARMRVKEAGAQG